MDGDAMLVAESVRKCYRTSAEEVEALRSIDLTVHAGEFVAIMGTSGSGKTTMLNCLSGLDDIDGGNVLIDGEDIHAMPDNRRTRHRASSMGFIFQSFNLIPVFDATENVELPLLLSGVPAGKARRLAIETLDRVGLSHRLRHHPTELSGGEQQRVAVARAIAGEPRIVWADEPTGALDSETAANVMSLLHELHGEGLTIIFITHDGALGQEAGRLVRMSDGRIISDTTRESVPNGAPPAGDHQDRDILEPGDAERSEHVIDLREAQLQERIHADSNESLLELAVLGAAVRDATQSALAQVASELTPQIVREAILREARYGSLLRPLEKTISDTVRDSFASELLQRNADPTH
ncbi:MAG: ABC transporter ATP-binding protein [Actinobacteria bacterium]|nr:ABC transporter ATP-binding protein [Actinomycetota bacterium]